MHVMNSKNGRKRKDKKMHLNTRGLFYILYIKPVPVICDLYMCLNHMYTLNAHSPLGAGVRTLRGSHENILLLLLLWSATISDSENNFNIFSQPVPRGYRKSQLCGWVCIYVRLGCVRDPLPRPPPILSV